MVHFTRRPVVLEAKIDGFAAPVHVRVPSTDLRVYDQVVLRQEYDLPARREPSFIVDAGANIGLASVFFANRYPNARILSLEPEKGNYEMLVRNCTMSCGQAAAAPSTTRRTTSNTSGCRGSSCA